jgi:hypothetical protein
VIFNLKKVTKKNSPNYDHAFKHNLREISAEKGGYGSIDPNKSHLNQIIYGKNTSQEIGDELDRILRTYQRTIRKDAVKVIEAMFSLSNDFLGDSEAFFRDCLKWIKGYYKIPVLSACIHFDETYRHLHVLMVPLLEGSLSARDIVGNRKDCYLRQKDFSNSVCMKYGITVSGLTKSLSHLERNKLGTFIWETLVKDPKCLIANEYLWKMIFKKVALDGTNACGYHPELGAQEITFRKYE